MKTNNSIKGTKQLEPKQAEIVQNDELNDNELENINGGVLSYNKSKIETYKGPKPEDSGIVAILIG